MRILIFDHTKSRKDIDKAMLVVAKYVPVPIFYEILDVAGADCRFVPPALDGHYHVDPKWFRDTYTVNAKGNDFVVAYFSSKQWSNLQKKNRSKAESIEQNFGVSEIALSGSFKKKESKQLAPKTRESQFVTRLLHEMCHGMFDHKLHVKDVTHYWHYEKKNLLEAIKLWVPKAGRTILFETALSCLGTDATPDDIVPDELGCADTVNAVYKKAFGKPIGGGASTYWLYDALLKSKDFIKVDMPLPGDIVISPTGYGNGKLSNGHVGIVGAGGLIMSNDSRNGLFWTNYTIDTWRKRYAGIGGYPVHFFRRI